MTRFERKFGVGFLASLPTTAGIYRFLDADGVTVYVGKSRNLRARLTQYSKARRGKMRKIVLAASSLEWELLDTELAALLRELKLIQELGPALNVVGKFSFLYPFLGISRISAHEWAFCVTTTAHSEAMKDFEWFGCYRSGSRVREAHRGLTELLRFVAHPTPIAAAQKASFPPYTTVRVFRRIPESFRSAIPAFFRGDSDLLLPLFFDTLLDLKAARASAKDLQTAFEALQEFWDNEAVPLRAAIEKNNCLNYPIAQLDRDALFLNLRATADIG